VDNEDTITMADKTGFKYVRPFNLLEPTRHSEIPQTFPNMVLEKDGDQLDGSCAKVKYSGTSVHERPCSRKIRFTNKFSEQKSSRITNTQAGNIGKLRVSARECQLPVNFGSVHIPACIRRAFC
jgi:hypothetical protein